MVARAKVVEVGGRAEAQVVVAKVGETVEASGAVAMAEAEAKVEVRKAVETGAEVMVVVVKAVVREAAMAVVFAAEWRCKSC